MRLVPRAVRGVLAAITLGAAAAAPAAPPGPDALDALRRQGEDRPAAALAALDALDTPAAADARREHALAAAEIAARAADAADAARRRDAALAAARALGPEAEALASADDAFLQALRAEQEEQSAMTGHARNALAGYEAWCGRATAASAPAALPCEHRPRWRLHQLLAAHARAQHAQATARQHALAALELAAAAGDTGRQAWAEAELALAAAQERDALRAQQHMARALQHGAADGDGRLLARLAIAEGNMASDLGDAARADAAQRRALATARATDAPRLAATALVNLSDQAVRAGRAAEALDAALQGLVLARPLKVPRIERALTHNAMLARVALGQKVAARADFEALQAAWAADGATGQQVTSMREFGDALARAGDLKGALELHHREAALAEQLRQTNRENALAELRTRYDREAEQRRILLLERDNALKGAAIENQALTRQLWTVGAGVLALAMLLMLLLVRRVRETNRALEHNRARLRVQSERDALTGLANRRHFQALLHADAAAGFTGALLMVDIDHFKHINDDHGHGVGDQVLVEVARRIAGAVRTNDTVARWGGEEFLILAPGLHRGDCETLAQRLLQAVAGVPVPLDGGRTLRVTASIGHAVFPLPPHAVALSPEQAVNLADMALYTAKSQGRNRAVGIVDAEAADASALQRLEADFERAWVEGRVRLRIDKGPPDTDQPQETTRCAETAASSSSD